MPKTRGMCGIRLLDTPVALAPTMAGLGATVDMDTATLEVQDTIKRNQEGVPAIQAAEVTVTTPVATFTTTMLVITTPGGRMKTTGA